MFVANALSPAQVLGVRIDTEHRIANVTVPERMLSLAIGREGQNARLAARLTGWRIDIRSDVAAARGAASPTARRRRRSPRTPTGPPAQPPPRRRRDTGARRRGRRRGAGDRARRGSDRARGRRRAGRGRRGTRREGDEAAQDDQDDEGRRSRTPTGRRHQRRHPRGRARGGRRRREAEAHPEDQGRRGRRRRGGVVVGPAAPGRSGTVAPRPLPTRSCVACRTARPKRELVRIVRAPDGHDRHRPDGSRARARRLPVPGRVLLGRRVAQARARARARRPHPGGRRGRDLGRSRRPHHQHTPRRRPDAGPHHRY